MFDLERIRHGYFVRGLIHLQRNNLAAAKEAFIAADDFPNARRQIPFILKDLGASPAEIIASLITALDAGDLQALPWIIRFSEDYDFNHPDIELFKRDFQSAIAEGNQSVLLGQMRIARESKDISGYIQMMIQLVKLGDPNAKCELVNLIVQAEVFPDEYSEFVKQQKELPGINGQKAAFPKLPSVQSKEEFLQKGDFAYLVELLNQGTDSLSSGAHILKFYLDIMMKRFETFDEYIQDLTQNLDYRWEDPHFLILFVIELHANLREQELATFRKMLEPYELVDLLNDLLREIPEPDTLFDDSLGVASLERTASKIPTAGAFEFFSKFKSPLFDEFIGAFKASPVDAAKKYSDFFSRACKGEKEFFQPTASALEFIDRGYFDFDLVDPALHGLVMRKLPAIIESDNGISGDFLEFLYRFENGEAYFLDDIRRRLVNHPNAPLSIKNHFYSLA